MAAKPPTATKRAGAPASLRHVVLRGHLAKNAAALRSALEGVLKLEVTGAK